jgi:ParB family chromosome partitioning protein
MEEAQGFRALLALDEPKYSIEQIAAKTGKSPAYVAQRLKLTELVPAVVEAFSNDEIGVGHALLLAKLQPAEQGQALAACFKEVYGSGSSKAARILLPVRSLRFWIETNIMLLLKEAPFSKTDKSLNPAAGACADCPKRTTRNKLLFADVEQDACTDPTCYQMKVDAHVAKTIAAKPKLVQITTAYGKPAEGSTILPRNQYVEIKEQPADKAHRDWPEYKTCKFVTEAIIADGTDKGELRKVCADPNCPVHHPKKQKAPSDTGEKARQEKARKEQALSNATGLRVLSAIVAAVPVRLMKRDLLFIVERVMPTLEERWVEVVARNRGIKKAKDSDSIPKLLTAYIRRAEEGELGRLLVEMVILQTAQMQGSAPNALRDAAQHYKVDTDAIALKVKQEFAAKEKAQGAKKPVAKAQPKPAKKSKAA